MSEQAYGLGKQLIVHDEERQELGKSYLESLAICIESVMEIQTSSTNL